MPTSLVGKIGIKFQYLHPTPKNRIISHCIPHSFNGHINKENKEYCNLFSPFFFFFVVVEMTGNIYIIYRAAIPTVLYPRFPAPLGMIY